ncbi:MAG TPA: orotidine-5'-phosphate decarboxylase [Candidatus Acidoferrales bacterium]
MDVDRARDACALARQLRGVVGMLKVGSRLFTAEGPPVVRQLTLMGYEIFLDLKFHDIPSTVSGAVASAVKLKGVCLLTLHTLGGTEVLEAAVKAAHKVKNPPALLGVTVLTSHDASSLKRAGIAGTPAAAALRLARIAKATGCDGVVASPQEVQAVRRAFGPKFLIVVPGIRPAHSESDDQSRVATPSAAIRCGADYLVIGRPITGASDPRKAATQINGEIAAALASIGTRA